MTVDLARLVPQLTLEQVACGLAAFARADIRDLPPGAFTIEPFRCRRCNDLGKVPDWARWPVGWAWQRVQPVPWTTCPDCSDQEGERG